MDDDKNQTLAHIGAIATRLQGIEDRLRDACASAATVEAGTSGGLTRVIEEIAAVRAELRELCGSKPTSSAEVVAEEEGLARAISELKSGEFDMQG